MQLPCVKYYFAIRKITQEEIQEAANESAQKQYRSGRAQSYIWLRDLFIHVSTHKAGMVHCPNPPFDFSLYKVKPKIVLGFPNVRV